MDGFDEMTTGADQERRRGLLIKKCKKILTRLGACCWQEQDMALEIDNQH